MTGRGARSPGQDLDAELRGRCRPRRPASRPRPRHHRWRPRLARPRSGRTERACAAAEAWPSHSPIAAHRAGPLRDGLFDLPAHRAGPKIDDRERPVARFRA